MAASAILEEDQMEEESEARCAHCDSPNVRQTDVRSAFWHGDRLVVVEDVPALVCEDCHEQFYDDRTAVVLDLLRGDGFPPEKARGELRVPVFSFRDRVAPQGDR
jgi:YgiT-type zinc finger domain-containing protein